ncbi:MAG TPA: hypothetical protein VMB05_01935 [Solirubrobacteraceae bacterium]|nr:hypothetical protein [Solirubrobacteraceae bacterium]
MRAILKRSRLVMLLVAIAAIALTASVAAELGGGALLSMLPPLALTALLLLRHYPGERALIARHGTRPKRERTPAPTRPRVREGLIAYAVRGTQLMARSLAVRPPPLLSATS